MKKALLIFGVIVIAIAAFIFMSPSASTPGTENTTKTKRTFASVSTDVKNGAKLVDVRTPEEFAEGHFDGAINFDSVKIDNGELPDLPKDTELYLYCRSGRRATAAASQLEKAGFTNVTNLGGLTDVEAIGGTLQK